MSKKNKFFTFCIIFLFFCIIFVLLFALSMHKKIDHDENQFIVSGMLLKSKLLLPYKDYPYFHMPNLVFIYALIFTVSKKIVFSARVFSIVCSLSFLFIIFFLTYFLCSKNNYLTRIIVAICSVIFILMNPLFIYTTGLSWNHDSSTLLAVLAFVIHCHSLRQKKPGKWLFLSGLSLGLAMGFRLSFALCVIPFIITILLYAEAIEQKRSSLLLHFSSGMFVSLLPALIMFVYAPKQFLFGNIYWRKLNTIYFHNLDYQRAVSIIGKLRYLRRVFIKEPGNLLLCFTFIFYVVAPHIMSLRKGISNRFEVIFILMLLPCILIGSLAGTPTWYQYYYALVPFMVLGILYNVTSSYGGSSNRNGFIGVFILITLISCIFGLPKYKDVRNVSNVHEWYPIKAHRLGIAITDIISEGRVLTLAPIFCLEGGLEIYEEFATGPFAWRTAGFLNERNRKELKMYSRDDLHNLLKERPPTGVLVGFEREFFGLEGDNLERPFESFAVDKNYKLFKIDGRRLWVTRE